MRACRASCVRFKGVVGHCDRRCRGVKRQEGTRVRRDGRQLGGRERERASERERTNETKRNRQEVRQDQEAASTHGNDNDKRSPMPFPDLA